MHIRYVTMRMWKAHYLNWLSHHRMHLSQIILRHILTWRKTGAGESKRFADELVGWWCVHEHHVIWIMRFCFTTHFSLSQQRMFLIVTTLFDTGSECGAVAYNFHVIPHLHSPWVCIPFKPNGSVVVSCQCSHVPLLHSLSDEANAG